jgi:hypothetical protein
MAGSLLRHGHRLGNSVRRAPDLSTAGDPRSHLIRARLIRR